MTFDEALAIVKPYGLKVWIRRRPRGWGLTRGKYKPWVALVRENGELVQSKASPEVVDIDVLMACAELRAAIRGAISNRGDHGR